MEDLAFKFNLPAPVTLAECESYDATIRATVRSLKVIAASSYFERRDILEEVHPDSQTVYYAVALSAILSQPQSTLEHPRTAPFYQKALEFLQSFDPIQVRYVGLAWRRILEFTLRYADRLHAQDSFSAVVPVREAILRLDQTGSLLTSSHLHFLKHCLDRKAFSFAIPLLDKDIYHIPCSADEKLAKLNGTIPCNPTEPVNSYITRRSGLTDKLATRQVLEYFLYGAMIYMGVGNWKRAIHFLNIVLRAPTRRCVSKVQVEAYKKWILANLIEHATVPDIHKDITKHISAYISPLARPYETVADLFQGSNYARLISEIEAGKDIWRKDCNTGLMAKVTFAYRKHAVIELGRTVNAIPISALNRYLSFEEDRMEEFLDHLIQRGYLQASLTSPRAADEKNQHGASKVLRFDSEPDNPVCTLNEITQSEFNQQVLQMTNKMAILGKHIKGMKGKLGFTGEYTEAMRKIERLKELSSSSSGKASNVAGSDVSQSFLSTDHHDLEEAFEDAEMDLQ